MKYLKKTITTPIIKRLKGNMTVSLAYQNTHFNKRQKAYLDFRPQLGMNYQNPFHQNYSHFFSTDNGGKK